jgi:ribosomal protein S18 acetylase RimI-like enzyme
MTKQTATSAITLANDFYTKVTSKETPPKGGEWVIAPDFDQLRLCVGKSFAGTSVIPGEPGMSWTVSHLKKQEWYTQEQHEKGMCFSLGFPIYDATKQNSLIVAKKMNKETKELASVAIVLEYDPTKKTRFWGKMDKGVKTMSAAFKMMKATSVPDLYSDKTHGKEMKYFMKKVDKMTESYKTWHKVDGPQEKHWYVNIVAVNPEYHGQGLGHELLSKVNELADAQCAIQYLECGAYNAQFYEKMGYKIISSRTIPDPENPALASFGACIMVREPH